MTNRTGVDSPASPIFGWSIAAMLALAAVGFGTMFFLNGVLGIGLVIVALFLGGAVFFAIFAVADARHQKVWQSIRSQSPGALILRVIPTHAGRGSLTAMSSQLGFAPIGDAWNLSGTLSIDPDGIRGWNLASLPSPIFFIPRNEIKDVSWVQFREQGRTLTGVSFAVTRPDGAASSILIAVGASALTAMNPATAQSVVIQTLFTLGRTTA